MKSNHSVLGWCWQTRALYPPWTPTYPMRGVCPPLQLFLHVPAMRVALGPCSLWAIPHSWQLCFVSTFSPKMADLITGPTFRRFSSQGLSVRLYSLGIWSTTVMGIHNTPNPLLFTGRQLLNPPQCEQQPDRFRLRSAAFLKVQPAQNARMKIHDNSIN